MEFEAILRNSSAFRTYPVAFAKYGIAILRKIEQSTILCRLGVLARRGSVSAAATIVKIEQSMPLSVIRLSLSSLVLGIYSSSSMIALASLRRAKHLSSSLASYRGPSSWKSTPCAYLPSLSSRKIMVPFLSSRPHGG